MTQVGNKRADLHFKENGPAGETEKGLLSFFGCVKLDRVSGNAS